jgi:hypothetical protein
MLRPILPKPLTPTRMGMMKNLRGNCGKPPDFQRKGRRRFPRGRVEVKVARALSESSTAMRNAIFRRSARLWCA